MYYDGYAEALPLHSNTQPLWSSGSTICFPPRGQRFASQGCPHTYNGTGFWVLLLAMSHYIGDPEVIRPLASPSMGRSTRLCADNVKSQCDHTSHAFPRFIPLLAGPPPPRNSVTGQSPDQFAGGGGGALWRPCTSLQYTVTLVR